MNLCNTAQNIRKCAGTDFFCALFYNFRGTNTIQKLKNAKTNTAPGYLVLKETTGSARKYILEKT